MARLSDELINKIKQEVPLVRLIEAKGFKPKPHGKDLVMCCPFHKDDTPSFVISPDSNLWHCMGACQTGGSVVDWIMKTEGVSFRHAVELLKNDLPHLSEEKGEAKVIKQSSTPKLPTPLAANTDEQTALKQVVEFYHEALLENVDAMAYLKSRGLDNLELIKRFKLGYANRTLSYRLPRKNRKAGAEMRGQLQTVGILRESGHEHFNGCLVVPIINEQGEITEVYGRKINDYLRPGTVYHLYLPGPHLGVWNSEALTTSSEVILCESLIDAMTFWVNGFKNVTCSYGTSGFIDDHVRVFKENNIERVLIAYDRDEAGNVAAEKLAEKLVAEGMDCYRIQFPKNMDVNEYALNVMPAQKTLGLAIRKAEWMGSGRPPERQLDIEQETPSTSLAAEPLVADTVSVSPIGQLQEGSGVTVETDGDELVMLINERRYRLRGFNAHSISEQLKLNILVSQGEFFHVDNVELYASRQRQHFIKLASIELGCADDDIKQDLGKILLQLELQQEQYRQSVEAQQAQGVVMTEDELESALVLLNDPKLLDRVLEDFNRAGVVGEDTNKLVGYLACVSRKLDKPLAVMIQSTSAAGKTSLMDAILTFMPEEERVQYSAMTGQSLYYMGEKDLKHKILAIAEEEGASNASYALKLLQSEGEVTIASTGKNATTGNLETQEYTVEGPVSLFYTTTAIDIDEELVNRCLVLSVDESREQTEAIHATQRQRRTLAGKLQKLDYNEAVNLHQNAQRLLRPLTVVNPFAESLTFLSDKTRTRRDHEKYLNLIEAITLLHQYQREVKAESYGSHAVEYIEVTLEDIAVANKLANDVLGRSLDELPPQTRRLLELVHSNVKEQCERYKIAQSDYRFSRKEIRQACGWTDFQVRKHMQRLEELEYVLIHSGRRGKSVVYELLYQGEGKDGDQFLMGLIEPENLQYDENNEPPKQNNEPFRQKNEPSKSPQSAPKEPSTSRLKSEKKPSNKALNVESPKNGAKCTSKVNGSTSYRTDRLDA